MNSDIFWSKVTKPDNGCWEWLGACTGGKCGGYGELKFYGKVQMAHRVAWMLLFGAIPDGLEIAHTCDNRKCCRPSHLFMATHKENMNDMIVKGRSKPGGKIYIPPFERRNHERT